MAGLSVLVAEEDHLLAKDARQVLEDAGAIVLGPFPGAKEAIERLEAASPDCAVLDLISGMVPTSPWQRQLAG